MSIIIIIIISSSSSSNIINLKNSIYQQNIPYTILKASCIKKLQ